MSCRKAYSVYLALVFSAVVFCDTLLPGQTASNRIPVPSDAAQEQSLRLIREVYETEYSSAKSDQEKIALATKLIQKAQATRDDPVGVFVFLKVAKDLAAQSGSAIVAFQAIDQMAAYDIDVPQIRMETLRMAARSAKLREQHEAAVALSLGLLNDAVSTDTFDHADGLSSIALSAARETRNRDLVKYVIARNKEVREITQDFEQVKAARAVLKTTATDPAANLVVGKYLCLLKGKWDEGLPMLAAGGDVELKALASRDLNGAASADRATLLGDQWWDLAEVQEGVAKRQTQLRAAHWYGKALPSLTGLSKDKVRKRLGTIESDNQNSAPQETRGKWVDLLATVDLDHSVIDGEWRSTRDGLAMTRRYGTSRVQLATTGIANYEVEMKFVRTDGADLLFLIMPVGKTHAMFQLYDVSKHYAHSGLELIDGKSAKENGTGFRADIRTGQTYTIHAFVSRSSREWLIVVYLDERQVARWQGQEDSLSLQPAWRIQKEGAFAVGGFDVAVMFKSVRIRDSKSK